MLLGLLTHPSNGWSRDTKVIFPHDPEFAERTLRFNAYKSATFSASVKPATVEDVQKVVKIATTSNVPFLATAGSHGYATTFSQMENGLQIDLTAFDSVEIDAQKNTMTVGGGTTASQIYEPLQNAGKEFPGGACSTVGVIGYTLGGGIGRLTGKHGMGLDSLLSAKVVTAKGDLINVSQKENADLFWGIRGGGFNFGIVIEATYTIYDVANHGLTRNADLVFEYRSSEQFWKLLAELKAQQPPELSAITFVIPNVETGEANLMLNIDAAYSDEEFQKYLQPFLDIDPIVQDIQTIPNSKVVATAAMGADAKNSKGRYHSIFGINTKNFDVLTWIEVTKKMNDFYKSTPVGISSIVIYELYSSHGPRRTTDDSTAYPWRDAEGYVMLQMGWDENTAPNIGALNGFAVQLRESIVKTSGYSDLTTYVSYAHGDETLEQRYGANKLARLRLLKKQWDPKNVFRFNNGINP